MVTITDIVLQEKFNCEIFYTSYLLRFIDSVRLMNDYLDSLVDIITCNIYCTNIV